MVTCEEQEGREAGFVRLGTEIKASLWAVTKQEGAVLAHLKQVVEATGRAARDIFLFKIYEFLLLFVSSPKLYPPTHISLGSFACPPSHKKP